MHKLSIEVCHTTCEMMWLKTLMIETLMTEFGFLETGLMPMHWDNQVAIYIANNPIFHEKTKHIEVDCHFVAGLCDE